MSHAVVSKFTDADDDISHGEQPAPVRVVPDHERQLEFVARERAILAWGRLRGIDKLDSATAERIITEAILDAVAASKKPQEMERRAWDGLKTIAKRLRALVLELWWQPNSDGDPAKASSKRCRFCGGSKNLHAQGCKIGAVLIDATAAGLGGE
jgi:hypothetical protein